jgi:ATP-dependent Clp protease ATP-binding subunit ClpB
MSLKTKIGQSVGRIFLGVLFLTASGRCFGADMPKVSHSLMQILEKVTGLAQDAGYTEISPEQVFLEIFSNIETPGHLAQFYLQDFRGLRSEVEAEFGGAFKKMPGTGDQAPVWNPQLLALLHRAEKLAIEAAEKSEVHSEDAKAANLVGFLEAATENKDSSIGKWMAEKNIDAAALNRAANRGQERASEEAKEALKMAGSLGDQALPKLVRKKIKDLNVPWLTPVRAEIDRLRAKGELPTGMSKEVTAALKVMRRSGKSNPVLLGPAGSGKTTLFILIYLKIYNGDFSPTSSIANEEGYILDLGLMVAGTTYRGQLEERLTTVVTWLKATNRFARVFIDELHNIVGMGAAEGKGDLANLLKPPLASGEIVFCGATTIEEYNKHLKKDQALDRRLIPVVIEAPDKEGTLERVRSRDPRYGAHYHTVPSDEVIEFAFELSAHYPHRHNPDITLELVDDALADWDDERDRIPERTYLTEELDRIVVGEKRLADRMELKPALRFDYLALIKRKDEVTDKLRAFDRAAAEAEEVKGRYDPLYSDLMAARKAGMRESNPTEYKEILQRVRDLLPEYESKMALAPHLHDTVHRIHVARVVAKYLRCDPWDLMSGEAGKYGAMFQDLRQIVLGQDEALTKLTDVIQDMHRAEVARVKPAVFFLEGQHGAGMETTVRATNRFLNDQDAEKDSLIVFDGSSLRLRDLTGAEAGYVNGEPPEDIYRLSPDSPNAKPSSVVWIKNADDLSPDVIRFLSGGIEDGYITIGAERKKVPLTRATFMLTMRRSGEALERRLRLKKMSVLSDLRLSSTVLTFKALGIPDLIQIATNLGHKKEREEIARGIFLHVTEKAYQSLVQSAIEDQEDPIKKIPEAERRRIPQSLDKWFLNNITGEITRRLKLKDNDPDQIKKGDSLIAEVVEGQVIQLRKMTAQEAGLFTTAVAMGRQKERALLERGIKVHISEQVSHQVVRGLIDQPEKLSQMTESGQTSEMISSLFDSMVTSRVNETLQLSPGESLPADTKGSWVVEVGEEEIEVRRMDPAKDQPCFIELSRFDFVTKE